MYAQDAKGRHVVIKMVNDGSEEYKVLRVLKDQPCLLDPNAFPFVVPILDLLSYCGHWFVVMPRYVLKIIGLVFEVKWIDQVGRVFQPKILLSYLLCCYPAHYFPPSGPFASLKQIYFSEAYVLCVLGSRFST